MKPLHDLTTIGRGRRLRPIVEALLAEYGVVASKLKQITEASNTIFKVTDARRKQYVLRIAAPKSCHGPDEMRSEVAWLQALAEETDIGCPAPVVRLDGGYITELSAPEEDVKLSSSLFRWVPGRMLDEVLTLENVSRQGMLMARLHQHAGSFSPPAGFRIRTYDTVFPYAAPGYAGIEPLVLFDEGPAAPLGAGRRAVFENAYDRVAGEFEGLMQSGERLRVIHNDLHVWNVKVTRSGIFALDFEDMMWGFPIQDIATTLYYYRWRDDYEELLGAFRSGYEGVREWPQSHRGQIDVLIMGRALLLANFIAVSKDSEDIAFAPDYLKRVEERLRGILQSKV